MARFDVYRNSGSLVDAVPYLVEVQNDLLDPLDTRVVIPLRRASRFPTRQLPSRLTPLFEIEGVSCLLETPKIAAVPLRLLKVRVGSLEPQRAAITGALDYLFQGY
jgi:toxin CcdB